MKCERGVISAAFEQQKNLQDVCTEICLTLLSILDQKLTCTEHASSSAGWSHVNTLNPPDARISPVAPLVGAAFEFLAVVLDQCSSQEQ